MWVGFWKKKRAACWGYPLSCRGLGSGWSPGARLSWAESGSATERPRGRTGARTPSVRAPPWPHMLAEVVGGTQP